MTDRPRRPQSSARRPGWERLGQILDRIHEQAIEAACELDRSYAAKHPLAASYVRPALLHEACIPGVVCFDTVRSRVIVTFLGPGLRARLVEAA